MGTGNFSQGKLQIGQHLSSLGSRDPFSHPAFSCAGVRALLVTRCDGTDHWSADGWYLNSTLLSSSKLCLPFFFFFLTFSCSSNFQQRDTIMIKLRLNVSGSTTSSCPTREIFYLQLGSGAAKEHSFRVVESTTSYKKSTVTEFFFFNLTAILCSYSHS